MYSFARTVRQVAVAFVAIVAIHGLAPAVEESMEGSWVARAAAAIGPERAEAQWGVSRRSARRVSRRTSRRVTARNYYYNYPSGATAVAVGSERCYSSGGKYYCPRMVEGRVVYVIVDHDEDDGDADGAFASARRGAAPAARPRRVEASRIAQHHRSP